MMKKFLLCCAVAGLAVAAGRADAEEASPLKDQKSKISYAAGVEVGKNIKRQGVEVDVELVVKGLRDALTDGKLLADEKELRKAMADFQTELRQKQMKAKAAAAETNKKEGEAFLAENKKKDGVVTLPSGLQYKVVKMGDGKKPTDKDTVECHYRGTLINGTQFDASDPQKPATFGVGGVIAGWKEALKLMPVGSKWQLFIPSALAYGERGAGRDIGPNAVLIFDIELLAIK